LGILTEDRQLDSLGRILCNSDRESNLETAQVSHALAHGEGGRDGLGGFCYLLLQVRTDWYVTFWRAAARSAMRPQIEAIVRIAKICWS